MGIVTGQDIRRQPLSVKLAAVKERIDRIQEAIADCRRTMTRYKANHYYSALEEEQRELERLGALLSEALKIQTDLTISSMNQLTVH